MERYVVESDGLTLSQICWRRFRRPTSGIVEAVLDANENQGLAALGPIIPVGTVVFIPSELAVEPGITDDEDLVTLWD